jgi:hypothetical protein
VRRASPQVVGEQVFYLNVPHDPSSGRLVLTATQHATQVGRWARDGTTLCTERRGGVDCGGVDCGGVAAVVWYSPAVYVIDAYCGGIHTRARVHHMP